jgi:glutathionylspermidine synthase
LLIQSEEVAGERPNLSMGKPLGHAELSRIERDLHLRYNKWDTQVGDVNVLSEQPLVLSGRAWDWLCRSAERLADETAALESLLLDQRPSSPVIQNLGVPRAIWKALALQRERSKEIIEHARVMRFDFHPTKSGWCVSEVNADVPGGWREGTSLPRLYHSFYGSLDCPESPLDAWGDAIEPLAQGGRAVLLSAPGYLEDEQVIRSFVSELQGRRISCSMIQNPAALDWHSSRGCKLQSSGERVSVLIRFYQAEWLCALPERTGWKKLFETSDIPVVNPAISVLSESKRFPLAFHEGSQCPTWRALVPECRDPREVDSDDWDSWVLKACYSNTGDKVYVCGNLPNDRRWKIIREAQCAPLKWIAQKRFETHPVESSHGAVYPCVGVFVVNRRAAGAYVRLSTGQVTSGAAVEAPLLIDHIDHKEP